MKISIITATRNSAAHIAGCLASVNSQTCKNIEHIIVDGASTDNTLEMIKTTRNNISLRRETINTSLTDYSLL